MLHGPLQRFQRKALLRHAAFLKTFLLRDIPTLCLVISLINLIFQVLFQLSRSGVFTLFRSPAQNSMAKSNFAVLRSKKKAEVIEGQRQAELGVVRSPIKNGDERFKVRRRIAGNASFCLSEREVTHGTT